MHVHTYACITNIQILQKNGQILRKNIYLICMKYKLFNFFLFCIIFLKYFLVVNVDFYTQTNLKIIFFQSLNN